jgi:hypothetical protein
LTPLLPPLFSSDVGGRCWTGVVEDDGKPRVLVGDIGEGVEIAVCWFN